jgi:ankyrin repeat protein
MMKKLLFTLFAFLSITTYAQRNIFHDPAFWREKPDVERIKAEILKGSSPTATNTRGIDPVVFAINAQAPLATIKYLLAQNGDNVNKNTISGRTYVFWAANRSNTELMEYLIAKGAKVNMRDSVGYTVLTYAAAGGMTNTKVYDICIREGANPKIERIRGGANALLLVAPFDRDFSLISYFINKGVDVKSTDSLGKTAFDYALRSGSIDVLKALIAKGVEYDKDGMLAASVGSRGGTLATLELYKYLEELKFNPNVISATGENSLHYVVRRPKQLDIINYFIGKGLDVNKVNNEGATPLMYAASTNTDLETIAMLIAKSKNINQVDKKGASALAMAVRRNSPDVVKLLIEKGADVNLIDKEGYNLAYYLIPTFAQRPEAFEAKLKLLQEKGFNIADTQKNGSSLYHLVLVRNGITLLKRIEEFKVDVNAKDKEGLTPLHKAAMLAQDDAILKYLLAIGAKKDLKTEFSETAFDLAKENEYLTKQHIAIDFLK